MEVGTEEIEQVASWIRGAERIVVLTGAGISTDSGITDFRGPQGVWTKNPEAEKKATIQHYLASRDHRVEAWRHRLESGMWDAEPGPGHRALAELERKGKLHTLVTQNVDGLHQKAGSSPDRVVEVHGTVHEIKCLDCGERRPMEHALERIRAGDDDPACESCGGILKSATISFGEALEPPVLARAEQAARECDCFLAVGTSLGVYPVAYLPELAVTVGAKLVIVNAEPTPYDPFADAVFHAPIAEVVPPIAEAV